MPTHDTFYEFNYEEITAHYPPSILIDLSGPVRRLQGHFGEAEYLLNCIIEDVGDLVHARRNINTRVRKLMNEYLDTGRYERPKLFDMFIAFEQVALDVLDTMQQFKLYIYGRYLPYEYETILDRGSVLLSKFIGLEQFCDAYPGWIPPDEVNKTGSSFNSW